MPVSLVASRELLQFLTIDTDFSRERCNLGVSFLQLLQNIRYLNKTINNSVTENKTKNT